MVGHRRFHSSGSFAALATLLALLAASVRSPWSFYCLNVHLHVKPERRDEFLQQLRANREGTLRDEPLAVAYMFGEAEANVFHLHEQYRGREGLDAHKEAPHFAEWKKFLATEPLAEPAVAYKFSEQGMPHVSPPYAGKRYCLNVRMSIKPERRDDFLLCIGNNLRGTLDTEPLALAYLFGEDENRPGTFHFHEQYKGREGFEAHTQAPHFAAWEDFVKTDPFSEAPEVAFFTED